MKHLTKLFRLLEITRAQPQYGFTLAEIHKSDLSDLAQHHYLATAFGWQLARLVKRSGVSLDVERVLEIGRVHDLGELFGGDIALPYARSNPKAKELSRQFEKENLRYLSDWFGEDKEHFAALAQEAMEPSSLEGVIAKIADYVEVTHYKLYMHRLSQNDVEMVVKSGEKMIASLSEPKAEKVLRTFLEQWAADLGKGKMEELFEEFKKE